MVTLSLLLPVFAARENIRELTHQSESLGIEKSLYVYVPSNAEEDERFPVLFVLHGAWGSYKDWVEKTDIEEIADHYRMILVFPDGSEFGWYVDSPEMENSNYQAYVAEELVNYMDANFPTVKSRKGRGIMGLSMGGHGALLMAAKFPDTFGSASSLSGILRISNHPEKWHISEKLGPFEKYPERWRDNSVWDQAERFKDSNTSIMFDCGEDDTKTGAIGDNRDLHKKLVELNIPHIWREMPGTHSWDYWNEHLEEHLNFHQANMHEQSPGLGRWRGLYFERIEKFLEENAEIEITTPTKTTICLFGSSSMHGFPRELLSEYIVYNRGISADVLGIGSRGLTHRMESSVFDMHPDYIFIKNGRNDLGDRFRNGEPSIDEMIREYREILNEIKKRQPEAKTFIVTCAPTSGKYDHLAESTAEYNRRLIMLGEQTGAGLIDLHKKLADENNRLKPEYSPDGLHITRAGYEVMAEMIKERITPISNDE